MANPSSETEEAVVEQYNEMVRSPMNFKLLDYLLMGSVILIFMINIFLK